MEHRRKTNVAVLELPHVLSINISENGEVKLGDYEGQFLQIVLEALQSKYEITPEKCKAFGKFMHNGTWTGMMGMMQRGEADLGFTHVTVTEQRSRVVNFSTPYTMTACVFVTVLPQKIKSTFGFLQPFDLNTWIAILLTFCMMIVLFGIFQNKYPLFKIFFRLFANFSKQSAMPVDSSLKYKILLLTWLLFVTVITFSWSATLLSFLVEPNRDEMVRNFRELSKAVQKGTHKATFYNMSLPFLLNSEDKDIKQLGEIVVGNKWFEDISERGKGSYVKYRAEQAMHRMTAKLLFGKQEEMFISEDTLYVSPMAFAYGKSFCCPSKLNSIILRLSSAGMYDKILQDNSFKHFLKTSHKSEAESTNFSLTITDLLGVFILLGVGWQFSIVAFLGEMFYGIVYAARR